MSTPHFSIVTPMFNRAGVISRAIESCLSQEFSDFELLIVDDGSTDESVSVVNGYTDSRVRLLQHAVNRGPSPARNTAIAEARGRWCAMLDSDFSFLPGALAMLHRRTLAAPAQTGNVASACLWDTGQRSPDPLVEEGTFDYARYLKWSETLVVSEYFNCVRREVFAQTRYPDSRAWEWEFHLNLAKRWTLELAHEPVVLIHTDAANRLTADRTPSALQRILDDAPDKYESLVGILKEHGAAMRVIVPKTYRALRLRAAHQAFLSGRRQVALRWLGSDLVSLPPAISNWTLALVGLFGPRITAKATLRRRMAPQTPSS